MIKKKGGGGGNKNLFSWKFLGYLESHVNYAALVICTYGVQQKWSMWLVTYCVKSHFNN